MAYKDMDVLSEPLSEVSKLRLKATWVTFRQELLGLYWFVSALFFSGTLCEVPTLCFT
jgi:hypothetical protein